MVEPKQVSLPTLQITDTDMRALRKVVDRFTDGRLGESAELLELELDRASVVPEASIPPDVVTMRSRAAFEDIETRKRRELVLVYPNESDPAEGKVSVLAPVGLALLGLRVGDTIRWPMPRKRAANLKLLEVCYQPEAEGAFDR